MITLIGGPRKAVPLEELDEQFRILFRCSAASAQELCRGTLRAANRRISRAQQAMNSSSAESQLLHAPDTRTSCSMSCKTAPQNRQSEAPTDLVGACCCCATAVEQLSWCPFPHFVRDR